jgi:hypothetical protein
MGYIKFLCLTATTQPRTQNRIFLENNLACANITLHKLQISIADIPRATSTVRTFTISCQGLKGPANLSYIFKQLRFDPSSTRFLFPALTSLVMIGIVLDDSIMRMVESRRVAAGVTRLESISIADADGTSQAHLERLQHLEGLRVMVD